MILGFLPLIKIEGIPCIYYHERPGQMLLFPSKDAAANYFFPNHGERSEKYASIAMDHILFSYKLIPIWKKEFILTLMENENKLITATAITGARYGCPIKKGKRHHWKHAIDVPLPKYYDAEKQTNSTNSGLL
jgi:hypothetical protein